MDDQGSVPAGWYDDPARYERQRWWDGSRWTDQTRPSTEVAAIRSGPPEPAVVRPGQFAPPSEPRPPRSRRVLVGAASLLVAVALGVVVWIVAPREVVDDPPLAVVMEEQDPTPTDRGSDADDDDPPGGTSQAEEPTPSEPAEELRTSPQTPDRSLVLGYLLPETGMLAFLGPPMITGVELAVEEINGLGGIGGFPVVLLSGDTGGDAAIARAEADRLLAADVDAIVGPAATGMTLEVIDQVTQAGVVQCSPSNTSPGLSDYPDAGLYFRTMPSDALQGSVLAERIIADGHTTVAIAGRADDYGRALIDVTTASLEARGASVVFVDTYAADAVAFGPVVDGLSGAGADATVLISFAEGAAILQGLLAAGIPAPSMYGADGMAGQALLEAVESSDLNVLDGMTFTQPASQQTAEFTSAVRDFNPGLVDQLFAAQSYDCTNLIALSAAVAGSVDPAAIREHMTEVTLGDNECGSFPACVAFVQAGESIAYRSASGEALAFMEVRQGSGEPSRGLVDVARFIDGDYTIIDTVVGVAEG